MISKLLFHACVFAVCTTASATTYYVSPAGSDDNPGTSEGRPFRVVQHAVDQMQSGDTLVVLDGVYSGSLKIKSGIAIRAKNPRKAVFSGLEPLKARFERHDGNIYKTRISGNPKQLFYNDQPMTWARWPNATWSENWIAEKKWAKATDGTGPGVLTSKAFEEIAGFDLEGGYCFLRYGKGNSCYSRLIESFDGTTLNWNDDNFYTSKYTGEDGRKGAPEVLKDPGFSKRSAKFNIHPRNSRFFLAGALVLLDAPGEWFVKDGFLYLYPTDGKDPNEAAVLVKTTDFCIDEEESVSDITVEGVDFLGCSVRLAASGNSNIGFENCHFKYGGAELLYIDRVQGWGATDKPIFIAGANIRIEKCLFAGAQNTGLKLRGSDLTVRNSVFMENNRHANFESRALLVENDGKYQITRNTFFNNCSDAIRILPDLSKEMSQSPEVSYNHILNGGIYNTDCSGIYMPSMSQAFADVHHNWIHDIMYAYRLDIAGKDLNLHHNVFWSSKRGMSVEGYGNFNIYNNTDVHNREPSEIIRNVLNHSDTTNLLESSLGSMELDFPPIEDWNVLNNLVENFNDRIGPRERTTQLAQERKGLLHPERAESWLIPIVNRGSMQGNLIGERREIFTNGELSGLNLIPTDPIIKNGISQTDDLVKQGVSHLDSFRGAYDIGGEYWYPGSDWMPYGLPVLKTMAEAQAFATKYRTISIVPEMGLTDLPTGHLNQPEGDTNDMSETAAIPFETFANFQRLPGASPLLTCPPTEWAAAAHAIVADDIVHYIWSLKKEDGRWLLMHSQSPTDDLTAVTHDERNPVVMPAEAGAFDDHVVEYPFPFHNPADDTYYMYYLGRQKRPPKQMGLMVMDGDFGKWKRVTDKPVISAEFKFEQDGSSHPSAAIDGDTIHILYTGEAKGLGGENHPYNDPTLCHATAPVSDPANVTKDSANPVLRTCGQDWDRYGIRETEILKGPVYFHIFYGGYNGKVWQAGHVRTKDFRAFEPNPYNPILKVSDDPDAWDSGGILTPQVFEANGTWYMLYAGMKGDDWGRTSECYSGLAVAGQS